MIDADADHLLFVEPAGRPSLDPVIDDVTRKLTAAWRARTTNDDATRGMHCCTGRGCRSMSGNSTYQVGGLQTHSLCIHYVAHHRADVPAAELAKIEAFDAGEAEPTSDELTGSGIWRSDPPARRGRR